MFLTFAYFYMRKRDSIIAEVELVKRRLAIFVRRDEKVFKTGLNSTVLVGAKIFNRY